MPTAIELRELDDDELEERLTEYRRELLNLRFQLATGQLDNITRLSQVRRDVARVLTVLRDREIALAEGRDAGPVIAPRPARRRPADAVDDDDEGETPRPRARTRRAPVADEGEVDEGDERADDETTAEDPTAPDAGEEEDE